MRYCKRCILPDSRPNLALDSNGVCSACKQSQIKPKIDWFQREQDFKKLVDETKSNSKSGWDCVIPVSGGKDSTWQTMKALKYGLKPLCVTWRSPARSEMGQRNLDNLITLGVDHFDLTINPVVEKKFTIKTLKEKGSPAIPMHMALFSLPLQIAIKFKIPLVLWGENSAVEYGGADGQSLGSLMDRQWLKKYGVTGGTTAEDWVDDNLTLKELTPYIWPQDQELAENGVKAAFLGHYFLWDPLMTFQEAKKVGFKELEAPLTGIYNFADVDDSFLITLHHWIKWYKFGFTRTWDNLSLEIRNGRMTRKEAVARLQQRQTETPLEELSAFAEWSGINKENLNGILERFRNLSIWKNNSAGKWYIPEFLIEDWNWQ